MKKIINWFKENSLIKSAMFLAVFTGALEIAICKIEPGVSHLVIAFLLYVIICKDKTIGDVCRILYDYEKQETERFITKTKETKYWISRYLLEKLKLDFCKRKISLSEFLDELPKMEEIVRKNNEELFEQDW